MGPTFCTDWIVESNNLLALNPGFPPKIFSESQNIGFKARGLGHDIYDYKLTETTSQI